MTEDAYSIARRLSWKWDRSELDTLPADLADEVRVFLRKWDEERRRDSR